MGDDFIEKKAKSYRRQAEKVHAQEFNQAGVSASAPERVSYVVRFQAPGVELKVGEAITLANVPGKAGIRVMLGSTNIGEVDAAGSTKLRDLMAANKACGGFLPGVVVSEKDIAGFAKAKVTL